jgi:hypothetical protein
MRAWWASRRSIRRTTAGVGLTSSVHRRSLESADPILLGPIDQPRERRIRTLEHFWVPLDGQEVPLRISNT